MLETYFAGIDTLAPARAYDAFSPKEQSENPYRQWSANVARTSDTSVVIAALGGATARSVRGR